MSDRVAAEKQTPDEKQIETDEITQFNHDTDYDDRSPLEQNGAVADNSLDVEEQDPFSAHNLAIQQFIYTARVYDVLLALLKETNVGVSHDIIELHSNGLLLGPSPAFNGVFLTDEMNDESAGSEDTSN